MDFWPDEDLVDLQAGMRAFVAGRFPPAEVAAREGSDRVLAGWEELGAMGVFALRADFGMRAAVVALEELGRALVPGPIPTTILAAGLVDGAADGSRAVGLYEPPAAGPAVIEHADEVATLLWFAGDELRLVDVAALGLEPVTHPLDPLSPAAIESGGGVLGDGAPGRVLASGPAVGELRRAGVALTAALQLGVALGALDLATEYARHRVQFGRPIGSFQAVKHLLADMLVRAEVARSAVYAAACALDGAGDDDPERAVAVAKTVAGEAAVFNGRTGIQVHGGMGFTWEVVAQRYWKRAVVLDHTFGDTETHAAAVAGGL